MTQRLHYDSRCLDKPRQVDGLDIQPAEDGYIVHQPEEDRVHYLNAPAVLILELCDGQHTAESVVSLVREAYAESEVIPPESVQDAMQKLAEAGLIR